MAPQDPFDYMALSQIGSGLWVARNDSTEPPHVLGLVIAQPELPLGPTIALPFRPVVRDGLMAYITESELGVGTLGKAGVVEILSQLPSELTFMNLAMILKRVARIRLDSGAHLVLARQIYEDAPVMEALGRFCAIEGHVIFSEQGLFALMAQAIRGLGGGRRRALLGIHSARRRQSSDYRRNAEEIISV